VVIRRSAGYYWFTGSLRSIVGRSAVAHKGAGTKRRFGRLDEWLAEVPPTNRKGAVQQRDRLVELFRAPRRLDVLWWRQVGLCLQKLTVARCVRAPDLRRGPSPSQQSADTVHVIGTDRPVPLPVWRGCLRRRSRSRHSVGSWPRRCSRSQANTFPGARRELQRDAAKTSIPSRAGRCRADRVHHQVMSGKAPFSRKFANRF
jgi:hypothetical protein